MLQFFFHLPDIDLFIVLSLVFIILSIIAIFIVNRFIPLHLRNKNNAVVGNISALISIIYGVLVGLTALYLINNISATGKAVQDEANAIADIYRYNKWLKEPTRSRIHAEVLNYLQTVINVEWSLMNAGKDVDTKGNLIIEKMGDQLIQYTSSSSAESLLVHDMLDGIKNLYDARQQRIHTSLFVLNSEMWFVILIGTFLIIMINYLFGMDFYMHLITTGAVALMAASMIFLLVTLDRPFQGEFGIKPKAFQAVLEFIQQHGYPVGETRQGEPLKQEEPSRQGGRNAPRYI